MCKFLATLFIETFKFRGFQGGASPASLTDTPFEVFYNALDPYQERKAFGQLVLDFQNTKFKLAECKTEALIARNFVDQCVLKLVEGELDATTASMAKYWCTQKQCEIIDECVQLHGGAGYMDEYEISRLYTDSRVQKIYGGTNEIMKELISRSL